MHKYKLCHKKLNLLFIKRKFGASVNPKFGASVRANFRKSRCFSALPHLPLLPGSVEQQQSRSTSKNSVTAPSRPTLHFMIFLFINGCINSLEINVFTTAKKRRPLKPAEGGGLNDRREHLLCQGLLLCYTMRNLL